MPASGDRRRVASTPPVSFRFRAAERLAHFPIVVFHSFVLKKSPCKQRFRLALMRTEESIIMYFAAIAVEVVPFLFCCPCPVALTVIASCRLLHLF